MDELSLSNERTKLVRRDSHLTQQIPFYLLYFFSVYVFFLIVQLGILPFTISAKWAKHTKEPDWIFPVDIIVTSMLVIEVGVQMFVTIKAGGRGWRDFFSSRDRVVGFIVACLSTVMIVLDIIAKQVSKDVEDGEIDAGRIDLFRDILRGVRAFEFLDMLREVLENPEWHTDPSLSMNSI